MQVRYPAQMRWKWAQDTYACMIYSTSLQMLFCKKAVVRNEPFLILFAPSLGRIHLVKHKQLDSLGVHHWKSLFLTWHLWFHLLNCFQISDGLGKFHLHFLANWGTVKFTWALRTYSLTDLEAGGMWENPPADWNLTTSVHWMVFHSLQLS